MVAGEFQFLDEDGVVLAGARGDSFRGLGGVAAEVLLEEGVFAEHGGVGEGVAVAVAEAKACQAGVGVDSGGG